MSDIKTTLGMSHDEASEILKELIQAGGENGDKPILIDVVTVLQLVAVALHAEREQCALIADTVHATSDEMDHRRNNPMRADGECFAAASIAGLIRKRSIDAQTQGAFNG